MTGFQQIVNENPYNYLGLVASWDYAATSLIAGLQGGSGGGNTDNPDFENEDTEENFSEDIITDDIVENQIDDLIDDPQEKSNKNSKYKNNSKKSLITNSKVFQEKIFSTFKNSRDHEIQKIKDLQSKVETHTATKQEKSEYESKRILNSLIRTSKPENIYEHINSINTDIQKLFSKRNSLESIENKVLIPTEYNLSQNYPNPFNPTTKINFSLPEDGKIKLTVYDILGREVKRLINSEFRSAGRYTVEFIGTGLSSGVYFYKLEAGKFVQTKRMVLIK
ncbi:MAG TPA: hypothetical protein DCY06_03755 [Bacteroidetes bacterium]|nr:hypothetical protein [Bacteroidota bacterium]